MVDQAGASWNQVGEWLRWIATTVLSANVWFDFRRDGDTFTCGSAPRRFTERRVHALERQSEPVDAADNDAKRRGWGCHLGDEFVVDGAGRRFVKRKRRDLFER